MVAVSPEVDENGDHLISDFSNRCGIAAEYCIAAPGQMVRTAYFGPDDFGPDSSGEPVRGTLWRDGSSYATPFVTGSLVVMKHAFRNELSNTELVDRLLQTADNTGRYANRAVYGRGFLDLGAALAPVGPLSMSMSNHVDKDLVRLDETGLNAGLAFGNALSSGFSGREFVAFDILGAPFWADAGLLVREKRVVDSYESLKAFMAESHDMKISLEPDSMSFKENKLTNGDVWSLGYVEKPSSGHLSLMGRGLTFGINGNAGFGVSVFSGDYDEVDMSQKMAAMVSWKSKDSNFGFRSGLIGERNGLFGSDSRGAFGSVSSQVFFAGLDWEKMHEDWVFQASAEMGYVNAKSDSGWIESVSSLMSSAFMLRGVKSFDKSALSVSLSQPLRVESGTAKFSVPTGRTQARDVLRSNFDVELEPLGRQIDFQIRWDRELGKNQFVALGLNHSDNPGHNQFKESDTTLLAHWRLDF